MVLLGVTVRLNDKPSVYIEIIKITFSWSAPVDAVQYPGRQEVASIYFMSFEILNEELKR